MAVVTLAVGIGASVMIYDAGRALATDAVPFPEPDRLVTVHLLWERGRGLSPSYQEFRIWESEAARLLTLGAYMFDDSFVGDGSRTFRVPGGRVTGGFFSALAMDPLLGRTLSSGDAAPGNGPVAVITQRLWEGRFGADPDVIGRPIRIDGRVHTVIGVVPTGLQFPPGADLWTPLSPTEDDAAPLRVSVIGRLKTGVTAEEAQAALSKIQRGLDRERPVEERASRVAVLALTGRPDGTDRTALPASSTRNMLGWERFALDGHAVAFALALAALTGIVFGIVPALRAVRGDLTVHLREGAPTATQGRRGSRITRLLLSGEAALALTLLLSAGLLTRSVLALLKADPGFEAEGVLTVEWALPPGRYDGQEAITRFQQPLLERFGGLPGVRSAGLVSNLPMSRTGWGKPYRVQGSDPDSDAQSANWRPITPAYLPTLGIALLRGRRFVRTDGAGAPRVAIVSEALANQHWPEGADPLGRQLEVEGEAWTVVGVAEDVHDFGAQRRAGPTIYVPQAQSPTEAGFLAIRVAGDPARLAPRVRQEIWSVDPDIALGEIRTLPRMVRDFYADERLMAQLMAVFASISLLITVVSLYTLVAHSVARRRREIGIRLALCARPRQVLIGAMSQGVVWVGVGIAVGLVLAAGVAQVLAAMLYGIRPLDPMVFILIPGGLLAVAFLASYVPALGATTVDPTETLRGG